MSARARIVGWMLLVVALALLISVFATWTIMLGRLQGQVDVELSNEKEKLATYIDKTVETTGTRDLGALLEGHLTFNVPDRYETFFTILDAKPHKRTFATPPDTLDSDPEFIAKLAAVDRPMYDWVESDAGRVRYAVFPVRSGAQRGAFVAAMFYDFRREDVVEAVQAQGITALVALAMAGGVGWFVAGRVLAPVRLVRQTAERISDSSDLTRRLDVPGNDDVAALARTFNHMLDRLERAFAAQREFVDDAGHELRTPITVIRGHLELMGDDPADRIETIALVTDELSRMNRIVDDLLTLAKSEQPGFIAMDEVEVADLTVSVLAKARALGERNWRVDEVADLSILADRQRLTQALMQLLANAFRHTAQGDLIAVGSAVRGAWVELWVRDAGPGVRPEDREKIFGRFVRAGSRHHEGAGLGLAIVRSIAEGHGGNVRVADADTGGALFTISIPLGAAPRVSPVYAEETS
ncbi:two-component sensor histidine kinase [Microtetraspora sp. NBRC 13810]|uniref:sensor histidine kinase n=1 Tax=Microtetraspora sp. NBRC 13810 TaxID=3030990 RepID=UPI00249FD31E|nr:HAMP domain-containing sensor histidine kinase [Microtetraspora sp. NBRC 13810]GLW07571.1 two-component sensor histidine kinase [Microtetraspora sp. NBRC 13810]